MKNFVARTKSEAFLSFERSNFLPSTSDRDNFFHLRARSSMPRQVWYPYTQQWNPSPPSNVVTRGNLTSFPKRERKLYATVWRWWRILPYPTKNVSCKCLFWALLCFHFCTQWSISAKLILKKYCWPPSHGHVYLKKWIQFAFHFSACSFCSSFVDFSYQIKNRFTPKTI